MMQRETMRVARRHHAAKKFSLEQRFFQSNTREAMLHSTSKFHFTLGRDISRDRNAAWINLGARTRNRGSEEQMPSDIETESLDEMTHKISHSQPNLSALAALGAIQRQFTRH